MMGHHGTSHTLADLKICPKFRAILELPIYSNKCRKITGEGEVEASWIEALLWCFSILKVRASLLAYLRTLRGSDLSSTQELTQESIQEEIPQEAWKLRQINREFLKCLMEVRTTEAWVHKDLLKKLEIWAELVELTHLLMALKEWIMFKMTLNPFLIPWDRKAKWIANQWINRLLSKLQWDLQEPTWVETSKEMSQIKWAR